jgi:NADH-ubiquinone oxidoreductase chain 5
LAASVGLLQNDIKKIIAFSTISQLGYCYVAIGLSAHNLALFHLINHAMFKSLLFLSAGAVIHAMNDVQDIRKYGGLVHFIPMTYIAMLVGSLSLIAFPAMTGYYSKELIINMSGSAYLFEYNLIY